jgi:hypothetical protein
MSLRLALAKARAHERERKILVEAAFAPHLQFAAGKAEHRRSSSLQRQNLGLWQE